MSGEAGGEDHKYINSQNIGIGVSTAQSRFYMDAPRTPYLKNCQVIVICNNIAHDNVLPVLDYFLRGADGRLSQNIIISRESAEKMLDVHTDMEDFPVMKMRKILANEGPQIANVTLFDFIVATLSPTQAPIAPIVSTYLDINDNELLHIDGCAVFLKGKMIGELTSKMTETLMMITEERNKAIITTSTLNSFFNLYVNNVNSKVAIKMLDEGKDFTAHIKLTIDASVLETSTKASRLREENVEAVIEAAKKVVSQDVANLINYSQKEIDADVFGIGDKIYDFYPKKSIEVLKDWDNFYKNMKITYEVNVKFASSGTITEPIVPGDLKYSVPENLEDEVDSGDNKDDKREIETKEETPTKESTSSDQTKEETPSKESTSSDQTKEETPSDETQTKDSPDKPNSTTPQKTEESSTE
jgi:spore germination protein KC/spore germination protein